MIHIPASASRANEDVESHDRSAFAGSNDRVIELKLGGEVKSLTPVAYLTWFTLPNFYFHLTTAYDILHHNGVPVGKRDFLGSTALDRRPVNRVRWRWVSTVGGSARRCAGTLASTYPAAT
jgi:hypothetical protein